MKDTIAQLIETTTPKYTDFTLVGILEGIRNYFRRLLAYVYLSLVLD